jgi:flagellar basal-body rod protein FlgG
MQDFAINGTGFFAVQRTPDEILYTRDGSFQLSPVADGLMLATSLGYAVLNVDGEPIIIPEDVNWNFVDVDDSGAFWVVTEDNEMEDMGFSFMIAQFPNVQGLESVGGNLFTPTAASGAALIEGEDDVNQLSIMFRGYLELSNVSAATEMVDMIRAHRAYDLNSRAITTSDEMLQTANGLKR